MCVCALMTTPLQSSTVMKAKFLDSTDPWQFTLDSSKIILCHHQCYIDQRFRQRRRHRKHAGFRTDLSKTSLSLERSRNIKFGILYYPPRSLLNSPSSKYVCIHHHLFLSSLNKFIVYLLQSIPIYFTSNVIYSTLRICHDICVCL